jgi:hypothetical protein
MEEEFYGSIKLISGEEIFAEILPVEENGRTVLVLSDPVEIETVSMGTIEGLRMIPWIRCLSKEGIIIVPMDKVITVVEASEESEVVDSYMKFVRKKNTSSEEGKVSERMGYKTSVKEARAYLEKIYKSKAKE